MTTATKLNLRPLGERVILKPVAAEEKSAGGIILPDSAKEKPQQAEVVAVGAGAFDEKGERIEMTVKMGDRVVYGKYAGTEFKHAGESYLIVKESEIFAIVEG